MGWTCCPFGKTETHLVFLRQDLIKIHFFKMKMELLLIFKRIFKKTISLLSNVLNSFGIGGVFVNGINI
jgi:hypothetical protein